MGRKGSTRGGYTEVIHRPNTWEKRWKVKAIWGMQGREGRKRKLRKDRRKLERVIFFPGELRTWNVCLCVWGKKKKRKIQQFLQQLLAFPTHLCSIKEWGTTVIDLQMDECTFDPRCRWLVNNMGSNGSQYQWMRTEGLTNTKIFFPMLVEKYTRQYKTTEPAFTNYLSFLVNFPVLRLPCHGSIHKCIFFKREPSVTYLYFSANHMSVDTLHLRCLQFWIRRENECQTAARTSDTHNLLCAPCVLSRQDRYSLAPVANALSLPFSISGRRTWSTLFGLSLGTKNTL